jgi:drug/metabolite transporter (DMT)-like permease
VVILQSSGRDAPPDVPAWGIVFFLLGALVFSLQHWRFRTGWHMGEQAGDQFYGRPWAREFTVMLGYIALPGVIGSVSFALLLLIAQLTTPTSSAVVGYSVMLLAVICLGSGIWMAKEWLKPTEGRTPDWLK